MEVNEECLGFGPFSSLRTSVWVLGNCAKHLLLFLYGLLVKQLLVGCEKICRLTDDGNNR